MQLPREVIQQLRDVVFGFDTFYVTSVENYQANGVLFKGNLRGRSVAESYSRTSARLKVLLLLTFCKTQASQRRAIYFSAFCSAVVPGAASYHKVCIKICGPALACMPASSHKANAHADYPA